MRSIYIKQKKFYRDAYISGVHGWPTKEPTREVVQYLKKITVARGGTALDIGCGEGRHAIELARMGYRVYATEIEPLALRKASQAARKNGVLKRIFFKVQDVLNLKFPKNYFDVIVDYGVFHHIVKADNHIYKRNILRVLKPGGHLILSVFSTKFKHHPDEKRKRNFLVHRNHYDRFFTRGDILLLAKGWLELVDLIEEHEGLNGFYHVLFRNSKPKRK